MESYSVQYIPAQENSGINQLIIQGDLSIRNISKVKEEIDKLGNTLAKANEVKIHNISAIDITGLQLIMALKQWMTTNSGKVNFDYDFSLETEEMSKKLDIDNHL